MKPEGYSKKPLWIYLASAIFLLAPFFNFTMALWGEGVQRWYALSTWLAWLPFVTTDSWIIAILTFITGLALLWVRKLSYYFALGILLLVLIQALVRWSSWAHTGPMIGIGALLLTVGTSLILYFSDFRKPYLHPRIRWWETAKRYRVDLEIKIQDWPHPGILLDLSKSGALVEWRNTENIPQIDGSTLITVRDNLSLPAFVARRTQKGYGFRFEKMDGDEKRSLKRFLEQLVKDPVRMKR